MDHPQLKMSNADSRSENHRRQVSYQSSILLGLLASGIRHTYLLPADTHSPVPSGFRPERGKGSGIVGRGGDEGGGTLTRTCGRRCIAQLSETLRNRSAGFGQPRRQPRVTSLPRL